ncbi:hypothetical protein Q9L42_000090 (plasmid) [Methylomarinum sp. Ch1-1]|uniref:Uncharacterized protein n=1 Tax=Methylomarinum roseum TaxID=3067653 RepID=A0AAU7NPA0_9GAMM
MAFGLCELGMGCLELGNASNAQGFSPGNQGTRSAYRQFVYLCRASFNAAGGKKNPIRCIWPKDDEQE